MCDGRVLADVAQPESRSHVTSLPALVERALAEAGTSLAQVEGLAVSIGPGSFTGLRIGLALMKGYAFAGGLPLVGVATLEALAHVAGARPGETICAALDARKREVYAALFRATSGGLERMTPDLALAPKALAARLAAPCVIVGDATSVYPELSVPGCAVRPFTTHHPRGGVVARLGLERLRAGQVANAGELEPTYVRLPDAELPSGSR